MSHVVRKEFSTVSGIFQVYSVGSWSPASSKAEPAWNVIESFEVPGGGESAARAKARAYALCSYLNGGQQPSD